MSETREVIAALERRLRADRDRELAARRDLARRIRDGADLEQPPETAAIRADATWHVAPVPPELATRHVELATPASAADAQAALTSGADVWIADLEDSLVPTWSNLTQAQRVIATTAADLPSDRPVLMVRPRGLHLEETHLQVDDQPASAAVVDVVMTLATLRDSLPTDGQLPHLYLPKLESYQEAQWWDDLISGAEELLGIPAGRVRVSVLVETVAAVYHLEEILYVLRRRITGLAAGRWDYLFSHLRTYATRADQVLPDLESFTMNTRFLRTYTDLIARICHRRDAQAIGGPVALVPGGPFDDSTLQAQARLTRDKTREARAGFDGAWVLHPAQVPIARAPFAAQGEPDAVNSHLVNGLEFDPAALSAAGTLGTATMTGLRTNLRAALTYLTGWFGGEGTCVIDGHLQDFGTVELARLQIWQWVHHRVELAEGPVVDELLLTRMLADEVAILQRRIGDVEHLALAERLLTEAVTAAEPPAFLSTLAYQELVRLGDRDAKNARTTTNARKIQATANSAGTPAA